LAYVPGAHDNIAFFAAVDDDHVSSAQQTLCRLM
jgi:hypothetical protein